ncbi:MAG TPA: bifunctional DNA primase/polymerase [Chloroflexia bacterium]|nr:bifunctional DNA primase/polymerase [Chloroflexia bacterium]
MQSPGQATRRRRQGVLEFARRYLAAGWRLIPNHNIYRGHCTCRRQAACAHPGKHPRIAGWTDATAGQASNDPAIVETWISRWPWLNLGLATGRGILALDIDPAHGGLAWLKTWQQLLPPTTQQITGSGGIHLLYRVPEQYYIKTTGPASKPIAAGVDTRGDGGQIIVAPSRNVHGSYQWVPDYAPWDRPPTPAPSALLDLLLEKQILVLHTERVTNVLAFSHTPLSAADRPPADLLLDKYAAQAGPGSRNICGFHLALQLRDNGYSLAEAAAYMLRYQQALDVPANRYTAEEALQSLHSAYQRPPRQAWERRCAPVAPPPDRAVADDTPEPNEYPYGP